MSSSLSSDDIGSDDKSLPISTFKAFFADQFPAYLAMGMTPEQFWDGDVCLAKAYLKAYEIKRDTENTKMWMMGRYIYDAVCAASPIFNPLAPAGTKALPYVSEPYPLTKEEADRRAEEARLKEEKAAHDRVMKAMEIWMTHINAKKGGG